MIKWGSEHEPRTWKIRRALGNVGYFECPNIVPRSAVFLHRRRTDLVEPCCRNNDPVLRKRCDRNAARAIASLVVTEGNRSDYGRAPLTTSPGHWGAAPFLFAFGIVVTLISIGRRGLSSSSAGGYVRV